MKKILSYNLNGIRAALRKGLSTYVEEEDADILCFQEIKAFENQIEDQSLFELNYHRHFYPAEKKGYSGVAIFSKEKPLHITEGCNHPVFDAEGRVLRFDFKDYSVISVYFPSGASGDHRQDIKIAFLEYFYGYIQELRKSIPNLIVCGDYNICNKAIDIHNPIANAKSTGFLPEERAWMDKWFENGFTDSFRAINGPKEHEYTWWSYRANARAKNKGWRIDYISIADSLSDKLITAVHRPHAMHSDHCPLFAVIEI